MMRIPHSKDYFYKYIREENKKYIQKQRNMTIDGNHFIEYDRKNKESFKDKVKSYINQFTIEDQEYLTEDNGLQKSELINEIDHQQVLGDKNEEVHDLA
jgi:N-glycosylase/DNA lyase